MMHFVVPLALVTFSPLLVLAQNVFEKPIVPACSGIGDTFKEACNLCDLVALAQNLINFAVGFSVFVATLMFVYAGVLYFSAATKPDNIKKAHGIFGKVFIGLIIVICAWLIVDLIMQTLAGENYRPWNQINCETGMGGLERERTSNFGTNPSVTASSGGGSGWLGTLFYAPSGGEASASPLGSPTESPNNPPEIPVGTSYEDGLAMIAQYARSANFLAPEAAYYYVTDKTGKGRWIKGTERTIVATEDDYSAELASILRQSPHEVRMFRVYPSSGGVQHPPSEKDIYTSAVLWALIPEDGPKISFAIVDGKGIWYYYPDPNGRITDVIFTIDEAVVLSAQYPKVGSPLQKKITKMGDDFIFAKAGGYGVDAQNYALAVEQEVQKQKKALADMKNGYLQASSGLDSMDPAQQQAALKELEQFYKNIGVTVRFDLFGQ